MADDSPRVGQSNARSASRRLGLLAGRLLFLCVIGLVASVASGEPALEFVDMTGRAAKRSLGDLRARCAEREVEVEDPYHLRRMRYLALPLRCVLEAGYAGRGGAGGLRERSLLLRALDGYTRPVEGGRLLESGAYLAFDEPALAREGSAVGRFTPIDRRGADPAPFYLVWTGPGPVSYTHLRAHETRR